MPAFRFLTAGESHGPALGATIEGVPAGLPLTEDDLAVDLARRQRGYGRGARQSIEQDRAQILGGVRHGRTLGSPILLLIPNRDWENWTRVMQVAPLTDAEADELFAAADEGNKRATPVTRVRPGHADLAGALKYGFNDVRDVLERASARETAARVAAGGVARVFLRELGIEVWSFSAEVGGVAIDPTNCTRSRDEADESPLRCPDPDAETRMIARIDEARSAGDTVGGVFEVVVHGLPIGLGSYVHWDRRLDAALAAAVMSINIVKGVEFGLGFEQTRRFGSAVHDVIEGRGDDGRWVHRTNNAGGLTGGVTNGEPLVVRGAVKPISTLARPLPSADLVTGEAVDKAHYERSDISVVPAAGVVAEAMVMLTLAAAITDKFGGDTLDDIRTNLAAYHARIERAPEAPVAGGRRPVKASTGGAGTAGGDAAEAHGLTGTDEAGSGGDDWAMDVVLVGLPGSGKSVIGKRLAQRHRASFIDLDERIESATGRSIPEIFEEQGEAAFRTLERQAVADLGAPDRDPEIRRVVATGGGAVVDPRNRWHLYRGRASVWLDGRPEVLAQRLRRSPHVRPLVTGRDPIGTIRDLAAKRERFYAAATIRSSGVAEVHGIVDALDSRLNELAPGIGSRSATLLQAETPIGRFVLGEGIAHDALIDALERLSARRAILVSEPGAWAAVGQGLADALGAAGWPVERVMLPQGEDAKRLAVIETASSELARLRVERAEPLVAIGGGALGDAAGFLAATYLRGVPMVHVPTTLVAQIDSSIGGKTGVDLPEGKNLVGAFHQPAAVLIDVAALRTLPERHRRAALGEAVKMAALGDERLFELLEEAGPAIASGEASAFDSGAVAEVVERCAWAKVAVVLVDERERDAGGGRITLNLGHSLGHAFEAAGGYGGLLHGEAVAYGLRAACRIGIEAGVTPPERAERIGRLLDRLELAREPLPYPIETVLDLLATDKKHAGGHLRWVLPTADGVTIRADIEPDVVARAAGALLAAGSPR